MERDRDRAHGGAAWPGRDWKGDGAGLGICAASFGRADSVTLYIAGDTIWCGEVQDALREHRPAVVVVNAGAAQFLEGEPITMTADDVIATCQAARASKVVAVHMEAINHCLLTRADLGFQLEAARVMESVVIPADGEGLEL